jgi:hypothetical protein
MGVSSQQSRCRAKSDELHFEGCPLSRPAFAGSGRAPALPLRAEDALADSVKLSQTMVKEYPAALAKAGSPSSR